ncbi:hypothetical protein OUZ56_011577 [Daphnia magna]|uniref:Uncharacterized protein n=1 Tax=Daphnia magna TaxID=35525 RepID=A0ABQ9Z0H6_9CRUS|nr:hypothetical protein OUZ56_011577 [Daphnia magna]
MEGNEPLVMEFTSKEGMKKASIPTLADTGSDIDAIRDKIYYAYFPEIPLRPKSPAQSATDSPIICLGTFQATIDWPVHLNDSRQATASVHVLEKLKQAVICNHVAEAGHGTRRVPKSKSQRAEEVPLTRKEESRPIRPNGRISVRIRRNLQSDAWPTMPLLLKGRSHPNKNARIPPSVRAIEETIQRKAGRAKGSRHHPESSAIHHNAMDPRCSPGTEKERRCKILPGLSAAEQVAGRSQIQQPDTSPRSFQDSQRPHRRLQPLQDDLRRAYRQIRRIPSVGRGVSPQSRFDASHQRIPTATKRHRPSMNKHRDTSLNRSSQTIQPARPVHPEANAGAGSKVGTNKHLDGSQRNEQVSDQGVRIPSRPQTLLARQEVSARSTLKSLKATVLHRRTLLDANTSSREQPSRPLPIMHPACGPTIGDDMSSDTSP